MSINVRRAQPEDLDWLISQLRDFSIYFGTKRSLFGDEEFARQGMLAMMIDHLVIIAEKDGVGPVGFIAGVISPHMFNPKIRMLVETFWWVTEEYRTGRAGLMLLDEFLNYGKKNADWIAFGLESKTPVKDKSLIKRGFHLHERNFLMEVH